MRELLFVTLLAFAPSTIAFADKAPAPATQKSLYDRLGGKPAIQAVVHDFRCSARSAA